MTVPSRSSHRSRLAALVVAGTLLAVACSTDNEDSTPTTQAPTESTTAPETTEAPTPAEPEIFDLVGTVLQNSPIFSDLAGYVVDAGLIEALRGGPFTVFAPTNDAFLKIPLDTRRAVGNDIDLLTTILTYHVVEGTYTAADLKDGELMTLAGIPLTISHDGDTVLVNGFPVAAADIMATNGVAHVMGDVLLPPEG